MGSISSVIADTKRFLAAAQKVQVDYPDAYRTTIGDFEVWCSPSLDLGSCNHFMLLEVPSFLSDGGRSRPCLVLCKKTRSYMIFPAHQDRKMVNDVQLEDMVETHPELHKALVSYVRDQGRLT